MVRIRAWCPTSSSRPCSTRLAIPGWTPPSPRPARSGAGPGSRSGTPRTGRREGGGGLAQELGVQVIHIAERDTQVGTRPKELGEFVNTWSVDGFVGEGAPPAEPGAGAHERDAR